MASKQVNIDNLPKKEKEAQHKWAQQQMKLNGVCVMGLDWVGFHEYNGSLYQMSKY